MVISTRTHGELDVGLQTALSSSSLVDYVSSNVAPRAGDTGSNNWNRQRILLFRGFDVHVYQFFSRGGSISHQVLSKLIATVKGLQMHDYNLRSVAALVKQCGRCIRMKTSIHLKT